MKYKSYKIIILAVLVIGFLFMSRAFVSAVALDFRAESNPTLTSGPIYAGSSASFKAQIGGTYSTASLVPSFWRLAWTTNSADYNNTPQPGNSWTITQYSSSPSTSNLDSSVASSRYIYSSPIPFSQPNSSGYRYLIMGCVNGTSPVNPYSNANGPDYTSYVGPMNGVTNGETNTLDNCTFWTSLNVNAGCTNGANNPPSCNACTAPLTWDGNNCTLPVMSGTLTPANSTCTIASGASKCSRVLTWTTANPVGTSAVTNGSGATPNPSASSNNTFQTFFIPYNNGTPITFYLYNNAVNLATATVTPVCVNGTAWDGSKCQTIPTPVNGVCGATHYVCTVGTSASNVSSTYAWNWTCNGSGGGLDAFCKENKPAMSGTLTPATSSCTIALGASTCIKLLTWTTTNPVGTSAVTNGNGATPNPSPSANNSSKTFTIPYGSGAGTTFYLYNNAVNLATANVTPSCATGSTWNGSICISNTCDNGASNYPTCTNCPASQVLNNATATCVPPLSISLGSTNYSATLPNHTISGIYTLTNGTSSNTTCRLLDGSGTPLTTYAPCTGSISVVAPSSAGSYGYSIQAFKASTGETKVSNAFTVNIIIPFATPPAPVITISANPAVITSGGTSTISWSALNVTQGCTASGAWSGAQQEIGTIGTGALTTGTYTYTLTCTGGLGRSGSGSATVTVNPVVVTSCTNGTNNPPACNICTGAFSWNGSTCVANPVIGTFSSTLNTGNLPGSFSEIISNLSKNTTYYFRAVAQNSQGTSNGQTLSFTTLDTPPALVLPSVTTESATAVANTSATFNGNVDPNGTTDTTRYFEWGTSALSLSNQTTHTSQGPTLGTFSDTVSSFAKDTTYYFRAVATNSNGTVYGQVSSFKTTNVIDLEIPLAPVVTISASPKTVVVDGTSVITYTVKNVTQGCVKTGDWSGATEGSGTYTTDALPAGLYTYTLTCTGGLGITGSGSVAVTSREKVPNVLAPTVTTSSVGSITKTEAALSGYLNPNGLTDMVRYFEWGTSASSLSNQTTHYNHGATADGFSENISGLTSNTPYYFRAVAENSSGTIYGTVLPFITDSDVVDLQNPPAPVVAIAASPTLVAAGDTSEITWTTANVTQGCVSSGGWSGTRADSGTHTTIPLSSGEHTFTLTCTGGQNRTGSASVLVTAESLVGPGGTGGGGSGGGNGGSDTNSGGGGFGTGGSASGGAGSTGTSGGTGGGNTITEAIGNTLSEILAPVITPEVKKIITTTRKNIAEYSDTPAGAVTTTTVTALGAGGGSAIALVSAGGTVTSLADIPLLALRLWSMLLVSLGLRKKRAPWGTVYDSVTKQPLDPVYVILNDQAGKEIKTAITDLDGRFGFLVPPGSYQITTKKTNYQAPSTKLAGKNSDELYDNLYFGGEVVLGEDAVITKNIPMDPLAFDWNEFAKRDKKLMTFYSKNTRILSIVLNALFYVGLLSVIILFIAKPDKLNLAILIVYGILLVLHLLGFKPKTFGTIIDTATKEPLSFAVVRVFRKGFPQELFHRVADKYGHYYCLLAKGEYYVTIDKKNVDESYTTIFTSELINAKKGIINENFTV
ncbi:MAG: hypothetical protein WC847_00535 [Candidatus Paceibacterota bacterium]|jgi:hypothetical protein